MFTQFATIQPINDNVFSIAEIFLLVVFGIFATMIYLYYRDILYLHCPNTESDSVIYLYYKDILLRLDDGIDANA